MNLRCKVFRAADAGSLEEAINHFLGEELSQLGELQFEEITQSEGAAGVTIVVWYSVAELDATLDDLEEGPDEVDGELEVPGELA